MKYRLICELEDESFRRLTGIKRSVFKKMLEILRLEEARKKAKGGRQSKLSLEDRLLLSLEYLREYRTYFHVAKSYGVSESSAFKAIRWIEDTLVKHPAFALPGKKVLAQSDQAYEVVLIDATETPIERPKKSKGVTIQEKRSVIR